MAGSPKRKDRRERFKAWCARSEALDEVCESIAVGFNLTDWCRRRDFSYTAVRDWLTDDAERALRYANAREARADFKHDEIERTLAKPVRRVDGRLDVGEVQLRRLQVDALKWSASKLRPSMYGDHLQVQANVHGQVQYRLPVKELGNEELLAFIRRAEDIPDGEEITDARLFELIDKVERKRLGILSELAKERGIHRPERLRIAYDAESKELNGSAAAPLTKLHSREER